MAKVQNTYEFKSRTRSRKYPLNQWFDGNIWELTHNVDFQLEPRAMQRYLQGRARKQGLKLQTNLVEGILYVQVKNQPTKPKSTRGTKQNKKKS